MGEVWMTLRISAICCLTAFSLTLASPLSARGVKERVGAIDLPPNITLINSNDVLVLADADGRPIYKLDFDPNAPENESSNASSMAQISREERRKEMALMRCADLCKNNWLPLKPPEGYKPAGQWSVIRLPSGFQLAYMNVPLYRFAGSDMEVVKSRPVFPPYFSAYSAPAARLQDGVPDGSLYWHEIPYRPQPLPVVAPPGIIAHWSGSGYVMALADGTTLYSLVGNASCNSSCTSMEPLRAPMGAQSIGEWHPVDGEDGIRRWSFGGRHVYRAKIGHPAQTEGFEPIRLAHSTRK